MEEAERLNQQIGLEEKNSILQAWNDFKDAIFNVLFVILDKKSDEEEQESLFGLIFQSGLDFLQMLAFPFSTVVLTAWNGGETLDSLTKFFSIFTISTYLPKAPYSAFLAMLYTLIVIIVLIILDIVYVSYSFTKKKFRFTFPLVLLAQIVPLFVTVLFLPITETLLSVVECNMINGQNVMTNYHDIICWKDWHLFHSSVTLLFVVIFVIISSIVALALFEPRMTSQKLTARQNSNAQVVFIINKIICQFIFSFQPFESPEIYVVMLFGLSFWQFWCYSIKRPYYSKIGSKFFKICSTYYFWTTLMLFVSMLLSSYNFDGGLIIWASGLPFFGILIYFESSSNINKLFKSNLKFKSGDELDSHLKYVLQLIHNHKADKNSYMLLIGYIEKHKEVCSQADCPLRMVKKKKKKGKDIEESCQQLIKQIERMYKLGVKKFPECTNLRISFAFFYIEQTKQKEKAYEEFCNASKTQPSFEQQFNIYRFKKIIRENLQKTQQNNSDLIEMIRFQNHISLCEEAMQISAKLHKQFWTQLKEEIPDLKKLNTIGSQITKTGNAIKQNYSQLSKITTSAQVLYSYATYLMLISEDYVEGRELMATAKKIFQDKQIGSVKNNEINFEVESINKIMNPILIISAKNNNFGRIINANLMFTEMTGLRREELYGKEMKILMPDLYKKQNKDIFNFHAAKLNFHQEDKGSDFTEGFLRHKFSYVIAVEYNITYKQALDEFHLLFRITTGSNMKMIILTDIEGKITDYNLLAQTTFKEVIANEQGASLSKIGLINFRNRQYCRVNGVLETLEIGEQKHQCYVQVIPLTITQYQENTGDDEQQQLFISNEISIGYRINLLRSQRKEFAPIEEEQSFQREEGLFNQKDKQIHIDEGILGLYDNPDAIDLIITNLAQTKMEEKEEKFELRQKIQTMRLMNNQIKMVYNKENEGFFGLNGAESGQEDRQMFKFDDQNYQAKLRMAINTNLNHVQVANLKRASILFIFCLFLLNIAQIFLESNQISSINESVAQIGYRANQYSFLTANLVGTLDPSTNYASMYNQTLSHKVNMNSNQIINLQLESNHTITKNLQDAVIYMNSRLANFYSTKGSLSTIQMLFTDYIINFYPTFLQHPSDIETNRLTLYSLVTSVAAICLLMMGYWIYTALVIDKKRYDIMIWFLDIPIPYVSHLSNHCDRYLKEFVSIKDWMKRGISVDEDDELSEEYVVKKNTGNDEDEIEEQIKARKSLISKNKKATLLSKITLGSFKVIWLLIYGLSFSCLMLSFTQQFFYDYQFLLPQWKETSKAITVDNTLYLSLVLKQKNISVESNLSLVINQLQQQHRNNANNSLLQFNYQILNFHLVSIQEIYGSVYFTNICLLLNLTENKADCQSIVGSKLKSGYQVFSKYLITPPVMMSTQIRRACQYYAIPALMFMLNIWKEEMTTNSNSFLSLCTILLYVFIILSIISFLLFWLYYLRKVNTELNQTIQMLNMIPFKLLPKSRKQTKLFITWIIREANLKKHQSE